MNPGQLGLNPRSAYSRYLSIRRRRAVQVLAALVCLLIWFAYAVMPQSAAGGSPIEPAAQVTLTTPQVGAPSVAAAVSARHTLLPSVPEDADVPPPASFDVERWHTELATESAVVDASTLPVQRTHVPFVQSLMAAVDPGASQFGHLYGPAAFGGGGYGGGGFGGAAGAQARR